MKFLNRGVVFAFFLCFLFAPMGQSSVALSSGAFGLLDGFKSYPMPNNKPSYVCNEQEESNNVYEQAYLSQKQAAAAALGLYFGVKHANAPQLEKEQTVKYMCL